MRELRRVEKAEAGVGRRDQEAAVGSRTLMLPARRMHVAALEQRAADAADLVASVVVQQVIAQGSMRQAPSRRNRRPPKLPDFSASAQRPAFARCVHGTPGSIVRADAQLRHAERLHDRARGFAAGHDQATHAALDQRRARSARGGARPVAPACSAPSAACTAHRLGSARRVDRAPAPRPDAVAAQASACVATARRARAQRIDREAGPTGFQPVLHLRVGRLRTRARQRPRVPPTGVEPAPPRRRAASSRAARRPPAGRARCPSRR